MPAITVRCLPHAGLDRAHTLARICAAAAHAFGVPERQVWAIWHDIMPGLYVEGTMSAEQQPLDSHPPLRPTCSNLVKCGPPCLATKC